MHVWQQRQQRVNKQIGIGPKGSRKNKFTELGV
jgi:hypothetical protein